MIALNSVANESKVIQINCRKYTKRFFCNCIHKQVTEL